MDDGPPTYRARLRLEGLVLAGCGLLGSAVLLIAVDGARRHPLSTLVQLVVVLGLLAVFGPLSVRRSLARSEPVDPARPPTGEPTPLWQLPLIVIVLAGIFPLAGAGTDNCLRVTGGCALVGLAQAVLLERLVARAEAREGQRYVRMPGSRIGRGTRLGRLPAG